MSVSRSSTGITPDFLAGKVFRLLRVDNGNALAETLSFAAEGRLLGYQVGRHWSWGIVDGNLIFRNNHNQMTDVFDRIEILGTSVALVGRLHTLEDGYWVRLVEQPHLDPSALVSFRNNEPQDAARSGRVAVLVRSHNADAKFDNLVAKLSRNCEGFDLYAMLDTTRRPITTNYKNTIYFNASACTAAGLSWPHPSLFHQYGDVAMSFAYRQISGYAFYIMVDDDVDVLEDDATLFNDISRAVMEDGNKVDLLGLLYAYRPLTTHGFYLHKMIPEQMLRYCYYPFIGLSARAAAFVFSQRQLEYARGNLPNERPMCEIFVPSLLHAAGFVCRDLAQVVPGAYSEGGMMLQFGDPGCGRPMGYDRSEFQTERMIHPVYTHEEFVARLHSRFNAERPEARAKIRAILDGPIGALLSETTRATVLPEMPGSAIR